MKPEILIVSTTLDFSTDFICIKLRERNINFLRLNRDIFDSYEISLDPVLALMEVKIDGQHYRVDSTSLKCVYFRAPTFLRDIFQEGLTEEAQLFRSQWAAFIRALIVFDDVNWVNHPVDTYKAENKSFQLRIAGKLGFNVPTTIVTNSHQLKPLNDKFVAVKSIDTAIVGNSTSEKFVYTHIFKSEELPETSFSSPFFVQKALTPKIDFRITIVGNWLMAVSITSNTAIDGDWRKHSDELCYQIIELPNEVKAKCFSFAKYLNLQYCAINMVLYEDSYYFIEVNPTGEWAFIQHNTAYGIDEIITQKLIGLN